MPNPLSSFTSWTLKTTPQILIDLVHQDDLLLGLAQKHKGIEAKTAIIISYCFRLFQRFSEHTSQSKGDVFLFA